MPKLMDRVDALIARRRLLDHPFYATWSAGTLSREALCRYAEQYYHWTLAFPTYLSLTHAQCDEVAVRQAILQNLNDEEAGSENHPELWLRFCDALGLDREAVKSSTPLPETRAAIAAYRSICGAAPYVSGLAALYAYESQQPAVMTTKMAGLRDFYGIETGHDFFAVHEKADVWHSAQERRLVETKGAGQEPAVEAAAARALDALYTLLDGVHARYVACAA